ncbi:MAG: cytosine deaminase [Pseudomonadota bacterium]
MTDATLDLVLRHGALPDGRQDVDIGILGTAIVAVEPALAAKGHSERDCTGKLISPPFVDAHFHLDSTLTAGMPRRNTSGTLLEGIAIWAELKPQLTQDAILTRALRYCELAAQQGLLAIRSHVDVCDPRLIAVEALLDVKQRVKDVIDLQLVAFPQDGYYRSPTAVACLARALEMGVDVVGGIPHFERTAADGAASVRALCTLGAERGLRVDLHCDETDDPLSRHVETLAAETIRLGLQGRVVASHVTSMHSMDNYYVSKLLPLIAESELGVIANPLINIVLQGRHDSYPKRRGLTRVPELQAAGVAVAFGQDCMMDPWYPLGTADMLDVAHMGLHVAQLTSLAGMHSCFAAITEIPARLLGLERYGLRPGNFADLIVLEARDPIDAIQRRPLRSLVVRRGRIISECRVDHTIRLTLP